MPVAAVSPGTGPGVRRSAMLRPWSRTHSAVDRDGPVTVVTIDRPRRRNAVDRATAADALLDAFAGLRRRPDAARSPS